VARRLNTCGVSPAPGAPDCVEVLTAGSPAATALFSSSNDTDDSETRAHYLTDRPPESPSSCSLAGGAPLNQLPSMV